MEVMDERNRYLRNPLRCLRALAELALISVDDNLADFTPYNEIDYPPVTRVERPVSSEAELIATEEECMGQLYLWNSEDELVIKT